MIELRSAMAYDAPQIARILRKARQHSLPYLPDIHTPEEDLDFIREVVLNESTVIVAETEETIVGFCAYRGGWIDHLYVLPEHHGKGIGTALLDNAKNANHGLELWTFQKNRRAIGFYVKHGFFCAELTDGSGNEEKEPDARFVWLRICP